MKILKVGFLKRKEIKKALLLLFFSVSLASCSNFEKEVEVDLPPFNSQLVIEAYIQKNETVRVAVMETKDYFSPAALPFVNDATVILTYKTRTDTLSFNPSIDLLNFKYFNYTLKTLRPDSLPLRKGDVVQISVFDKKGRVATAETIWIDPVQLDSVTHEYNTKGEALILGHLTDPVGDNSYRFRVRQPRDTSGDFIPDYFSEDDLFEGRKTSFGTGYRYKKGDTLEVTLYHLTPEYYNFLATANAAASANGNPFAQPAAIKSNVIGGTGIFTVLPYDRLFYILP